MLPLKRARLEPQCGIIRAFYVTELRLRESKGASPRKRGDSRNTRLWGTGSSTHSCSARRAQYHPSLAMTRFQAGNFAVTSTSSHGGAVGRI
jgi:hypothetical protein